MRNYIIITKEQAEQIRGRHGRYSAIEPVPSPDGNYLVPERCLDDPDLKDIKDKIQLLIQPAKANVQDIEDLPEMGQAIVKDKIYRFESDDGFPPLVIARQDHTRTEHDPKIIPALFSFFRENADDLEWIPNEKVDLGWKRMWNDKQYEVIQPHMTVIGQTPDLTPALWKLVPSEEIPVWKQPTGAHDAYALGAKVHFPTINDPVYESLIPANVYSPISYPAGWRLV
jgi:hypothetical protein